MYHCSTMPMTAHIAAGLFEHGQVVTTIPKAKAVQPMVEKIVTLAKRGRPVRFLGKKEVFDALGMRGSNWPGQAIGGTMNSTVRDMARMGELVLQRGRYDDAVTAEAVELPRHQRAPAIARPDPGAVRDPDRRPAVAQHDDAGLVGAGRFFGPPRR